MKLPLLRYVVVAPSAALRSLESSGVAGGTLYLYTTWQAPKGRVVAVPLDDSTRARWRDIVPEGNDPIAETILVGTRIAVVHLVDVQSRLDLYDLQGRSRGPVTLPEPGTVAGLSGRNDGTDFFFTFTSYLRPATVYRYDLGEEGMLCDAGANPLGAVIGMLVVAGLLVGDGGGVASEGVDVGQREVAVRVRVAGEDAGGNLNRLRGVLAGLVHRTEDGRARFLE